MAANFALDGINIYQKAHIYAMAAHAAVGQKRKYTNEPYIVHPVEVARILIENVCWVTQDMLAAAMLHDVVEDTQCTHTDIHLAFGFDISVLVRGLTDISKATDGNREVRKAIDRDHLAAGSAEVQTIKLADMISNTKSIVTHDLNFARVYLGEKSKLLDVLTKADPALMRLARETLVAGQQVLVQEALGRTNSVLASAGQVALDKE